MGAGGEAPPVRGEDVMILVGSSIILVMFIIQTWIVPTVIDENSNSEFEVRYDLSKDDLFSLEVVDGAVTPTVTPPTGDAETFSSVDDKWEYTAKESGVHTFKFYAVDDSVVKYSVSRGLIYDYALYPIGVVILVFGILKKISLKEDEPLEAVLDD
jgi:hypothetical protein